MRDLLLAAVGFLLFTLLFTDEFHELVARLQAFAREHPRGRFLAYILAAAAVLAGTGLILNALFILVKLMWSYD